MDRNIDSLHPTVASMCHQFLANCKMAGIDVIITGTYRSIEEQNRLYAIGRTVPGKKVTNAKGGQSMHNYRLAFDCVPLRHGKPVWGTTGDDLKLWQQVGAIGKAVGLSWAGEWKTFREFAHFQWTGGLTLKDLQAGKRP